MPLCGFNEKMLNSLKGFNEELVEHGLKERSEQNGETLEQGIRREIADMTRLLNELDKIDDSAKRLLTEGLVKYTMGFYLIMRENGIEGHEEVLDKISEYFQFMDGKYYSELEGKSDDMKELVKLLDEKEI
jgi:hypothetical protein